MPALPTFCGPSYQSPSYRADVEQTINLLQERSESAGATAPRILIPMPGLLTRASAAEAPVRAMFAQDGRAWAILGQTLYEATWDAVTEVLTLVPRGAVENDSLPATISSSGDVGGELLSVVGGEAYLLTLATNVAADVPSAGLDLVQGGYLDGYFLVLHEDSTLAISDLLDGSTFDPLQTFQRSDAADQWKAMLVVGKYIWLFGSETTSVFYNRDTFPFPFGPVAGALLTHGIVARFSVADLLGSPVWLAQSRAGRGTIVQAEGFGVPRRISNHAVEHAIAGYSRIDDAVGMVVELEAHNLYILTFPTADKTWCYDASSGEWTELALWDVTTATWQAYRPMFHCMAFGQHLVGDRATGTIYALDKDTYTDAGGVPMRRVRRVPFPRMKDTSDWVTLSAIEILMDAGIGLVSGQGVEPVISVSLSRNGKIWGSPRDLPVGAMGQYDTRVRSTRWGRFRDGRAALEVSMSDPCPFRFTGAEFEAS